MVKQVKHRFGKEWTPEEIHAFNQNNELDLETMLASIESIADNILTAAGFPKNLEAPPFSPVDVVLKKQIEERGFDWESREGYAVRILYQAWLVRISGANASFSAIYGMHLGSLITEATMHGFWERGFAGHLGGLKGAERQWGALEKRRQKHDELRRLYQKARPKAASSEEAYKTVARQAGVAPRTVRRAIKGY
jgi:hypothetical protein